MEDLTREVKVTKKEAAQMRANEKAKYRKKLQIKHRREEDAKKKALTEGIIGMVNSAQQNSKISAPGKEISSSPSTRVSSSSSTSHSSVSSYINSKGTKGNKENIKKDSSHVSNDELDQSIIQAQIEQMASLVPKQHLYMPMPKTPSFPWCPWTRLPYNDNFKENIQWLSLQEQEALKSTQESKSGQSNDKNRNGSKDKGKSKGGISDTDMDEALRFLAKEVTLNNQIIAMARLDYEIQQFAEYVQLTPLEQACRDALIEDVSTCVHSRWPDAEVAVFGSYASDMGIYNSDIDISIQGMGITVDEDGRPLIAETTLNGAVKGSISLNALEATMKVVGRDKEPNVYEKIKAAIEAQEAQEAEREELQYQEEEEEEEEEEEGEEDGDGDGDGDGVLFSLPDASEVIDLVDDSDIESDTEASRTLISSFASRKRKMDDGGTNGGHATYDGKEVVDLISTDEDEEDVEDTNSSTSDAKKDTDDRVGDGETVKSDDEEVISFRLHGKKQNPLAENLNIRVEDGNKEDENKGSTIEMSRLHSSKQSASPTNGHGGSNGSDGKDGHGHGSDDEDYDQYAYYAKNVVAADDSAQHAINVDDDDVEILESVPCLLNNGRTVYIQPGMPTNVRSLQAKTKGYNPADSRGAKERLVSLLRQLYKYMQSFDWMGSNEIRPRARVPIIAFIHRCNISVDISLGVDSTEHQAVVQSMYKAGGDVFKPLELDKPFNGGIGSFKLYVMVAFIITQSKQRNTGSNVNLGYYLRKFFKYFGKSQHLNAYTTIQVSGGIATFTACHQIDSIQRTFAKANEILDNHFSGRDSPGHSANRGYNNHRRQRDDYKYSGSVLAKLINSKWLHQERRKALHNAELAAPPSPHVAQINGKNKKMKKDDSSHRMKTISHSEYKDTIARDALDILSRLHRNTSRQPLDIHRVITLEQVAIHSPTLYAKLRSFINVDKFRALLLSRHRLQDVGHKGSAHSSHHSSKQKSSFDSNRDRKKSRKENTGKATGEGSRKRHRKNGTKSPEYKKCREGVR